MSDQEPLNSEVGGKGAESSWYRLREGPTNRNSIQPPMTMKMEAYANLFSQNNAPFSPTYSSIAFSAKLMSSHFFGGSGAEAEAEACAFMGRPLPPTLSSLCCLDRLFDLRLNLISTAFGGVVAGGFALSPLVLLLSLLLVLVLWAGVALRDRWWRGRKIRLCFT